MHTPVASSVWIGYLGTEADVDAGLYRRVGGPDGRRNRGDWT